MSSASWIYNARRYNYPLPQKLQHFIAQYNAKVTDDVTDEGGEELQISSKGGIGRSYLKFCDTDLARLDNSLTSTYIATAQSCPTLEPDNNFCRLICEFDNVGGIIPDYSGFNHHARVYGVPRMKWGIRYGIGALSIETVFDGRTNWGSVTDTADLSFDDAHFSLLFRFLPYDLSMSAVHSQVVVSKKDPSDTAGNKWFCFEIAPDGSATFNMSLSTVEKYSISAPAGTITSTAYATVDETTPRYDVCITFDRVLKVIKLYINGTAYTTFTTSIPTGAIIPDYAGYDLMIGRWTALVGRPVTLPQVEDIDPIRLFSKLYFGAFQQLKFWRNRVLTSTEVTNHYNNKVTIEPCAFGEVAIPNVGLILLT